MILKGKDAEGFNKSAEKNMRNKGSVDFSKQAAEAKKIIDKSNDSKYLKDDWQSAGDYIRDLFSFKLR